MSDAARAYAAREHDLGARRRRATPPRSRRPPAGDGRRRRASHEVAQAAAEVGIEPGTPFAAELAARLDDVGLGAERTAASLRRRRDASRSRASPSGPGSPGSSSSPRSSATRSPAGSSRRGSWSTSSSTPSSRRASRDTGHFLVRDVPSRRLRLRLPGADRAGLALFGSVPDAYAAAKAINSVVMSLAAIPAYFLARRVARAVSALLAAAAHRRRAVDALHGHADDRERLLPALLCVALALVLALERPTIQRQLVLLGLCLLAFLTRAQAIVARPGGRDRAAPARVARPAAPAHARRLSRALRSARRRRRSSCSSSSSRAGTPRTTCSAATASPAMRTTGPTRCLEVAALPRRRARSLPRDRAVRGAARFSPSSAGRSTAGCALPRRGAAV